MTPTWTASILRGLAASAPTVALVALVIASPAGLSAQATTDPVPRGVSPGSPVTAERLAGSCPTFSWSGVPDARGYELVLYRVTEGGTLESMLQTEVPGDARSWTPSASECPASGVRYAWAVRALLEDGAGAWSEPLLFATAGAPTDDEVRQALAVLRRAQQARAAETGKEAAAPSSITSAAAGITPPLEGSAGQPSARALSAPTVASSPSPQVVTPPTTFSGQFDGSIDLGGFVFKSGVPFIHTDGGATYGNTAVGLNALVKTTPGSPFPRTGSRNSAFGQGALRSNTTGAFNTASGEQALFSNTTGYFNTASGRRALYRNTTGSANTASGYRALYRNTRGFSNTANGQFSLYANTTGAYNTAIGRDAGINWTTGNNNVAVGRGASGYSGEAGTIRIGGTNRQSRTFIEGINGTTVSGVQVMITDDDQLGVAASSARFKQDIHDLEGVSDQLLDLRPVSFRYRDELAGASEGGGPNPIEFGLVAEEVAAIFPELVAYDEEGKPYTVRYHLLTPLLLGEIQRQEAVLDRRGEEMTDLRTQVADLRRQLEELAKKRSSRGWIPAGQEPGVCQN